MRACHVSVAVVGAAAVVVVAVSVWFLVCAVVFAEFLSSRCSSPVGCNTLVGSCTVCATFVVATMLHLHEQDQCGESVCETE